MTNSTERVEPLYVLDTNALIWYLKKDSKLGRHATAIFQAAELGETRLVIPVIVIAELFYTDKKHNLFDDFAKVNTQIKARSYFRLVPLEADDILDFEADQAVPEMHDRIIVGLARRLGVSLITSDPQIAAANLAEVVW